MYGGGGGGHYDGGGGGGGGHYDGGGGNANSLFGGGGFMPSQSTAVPESSGISRGRSAQTLLPLTVKQIMDAAQASDDKSNFAIDGAGAEVSTVRLVGRMLNKVHRVTDVQFTLDDGTGKIDVNRWDNEASDTKEMDDVNDGNYVIVNGGLKGFQGKRHVIAYSVRRVTDFNEITHHFLYCIHVHAEHTMPKAHINGNAATPGRTNQIRLPNNQAATFSASANAAGNDVNDLVLHVFLDPAIAHLDNGLPVKDVMDRLKLTEDVVRAAIQYNIDQGNIYSTIDDNHFKSVLNG